MIPENPAPIIMIVVGFREVAILEEEKNRCSKCIELRRKLDVPKRERVGNKRENDYINIRSEVSYLT